MKKIKVALAFVLAAFTISLTSVAYAWTWDATNWIGGSNGDSTWSFGFGSSYAAKGSTVQETISNTTTVIHNNIYQLNTNLRNGLNAIVNNTYRMNSNIQGATNFISGRLEQLFDVLVALDGNTDMIESYLSGIDSDTNDLYFIRSHAKNIMDEVFMLTAKATDRNTYLASIDKKLAKLGDDISIDFNGYYTDIDLKFDGVLDALDNLTVTVDLDTSDIARALYIGGDGKHTFTSTTTPGDHDWSAPTYGQHNWQQTQWAVNENLFEQWCFLDNSFPIDSWYLYAGGSYTRDNCILASSDFFDFGVVFPITSNLYGSTFTVSCLTDLGIFDYTYTVSNNFSFENDSVHYGCNQSGFAFNCRYPWGTGYLIALQNHSQQQLRIYAVKLELGSQQTLAHQDASGNWVLNYTPTTASDLTHTQGAVYTCTACGATTSDPSDTSTCTVSASYTCNGCGDVYSGTVGSQPISGCSATAVINYFCTACGKHYDIGPGDILPDTRCYAAAPGQTLAELVNGISYKLDNLPQDTSPPTDLTGVETTLSSILGKMDTLTVTGSPPDLSLIVSKLDAVSDDLYRIGSDVSAIALALAGGDDDCSGPCSHDYTTEDTQPATCQLPGLRLFTCSLCGDVYSEIVSALSHDWACTDHVDAVLDDEGNQIEVGYDIYTCLRDGCGATYNDYSGTGTPDANAGETSISGMLVKLFARAGTIAGKMVASVIEFFDRLLVGIDDLASRFNTMAENVSTMGGEYPMWLAGFWAILPSDLQLVLTFAFLAMVVGVIGKKLFFS